jgi:iron complex outermembrane recepter protein
MGKYNIRLLSGTALLIVGAAPAIAQPQTPTATTPEAAPESSGEIVVTAQRRSEKLVDVPVSVTALNADALRNANFNDISDLPKLTPSLRIDTRTAFIQPSIRGVGTSLSIPGTGSNVATYVDGFYVQSPLPTDFTMPNMSGIQVLKGPQGTLFGRNATGGAILIDTTQPRNELAGSAQVSYGSYNSQEYQGYVTAGLFKGLALDASGTLFKGDGMLRNIVTGSDKAGKYQKWSARVGVKADLTDNLSVTFHYSHADVDDPASTLGGAYHFPGGPPLAAAYGAPGVTVASAPNTTATTESFFKQDIKANVYQIAVLLDLDNVAIKSYTQWRNLDTVGDFDVDVSSLQSGVARLAYTDRVFTQELLATSKGQGRIQWTVGGFYFHDPIFYEPLFIAPAFALPINRTTSNTSTFAVYGDATYRLSDRLFLTAGLRYSNDMVRDASYTNLLPPAPGLKLPNINEARLDPRAVIRYKPSDNSSIYFNYSKAHKAAIASTQPGGLADPIKPEKIDSFELGAKYDTRAFSINADAFYLNYKDLQLSSSEPNGPGLNSVIIVRNAASVHVKGFEADIRYNFTPDFQISGGGAYVDAPYKSFTGSSIFVQDPVTHAFNAVVYDATGKQVLRTPKFTANASITYTARDVFGGSLTLSGTAYYTSRIYFDIADQFYQNGYALVNARAEWRDKSDHFSVALYADNIGDKRYYSSVLGQTGGISAFWGDKRVIGGTVGVKF